ncbi:MAG TPA: hypothetical protein VGS27_13370 [Candidatus Sulfotelmatobacter sp.]|nr:hypothetical protein [Candidatus Sulfotelmatobacter sp.]
MSEHLCHVWVRVPGDTRTEKPEFPQDWNGWGDPANSFSNPQLCKRPAIYCAPYGDSAVWFCQEHAIQMALERAVLADFWIYDKEHGHDNH